jgi:hypothetical protein
MNLLDHAKIEFYERAQGTIEGIECTDSMPAAMDLASNSHLGTSKL